MLAPFIYAYGFIFPQGDDFDEATRAACLFDFIGGMYEVVREWFSWSGRYTYHFLAVFFGKAAESRFWAGAVCFCVLASYGFAFWWLISPVVSKRFYSHLHAFIFSLAALVTLYASYGYLPNFYLLTDALSSAHQGATALLFLALVILLWQKVDSSAGNCKKEWRHSLLTGIFAIGVYEHAALAVICISLTAVCLALFFRRLNRIPILERLEQHEKWHGRNKWKQLFQRMRSRLGNPFIRPFFTLFICLLLPLALSFLAPGNFMRNMKRGVDSATQLAQIKMVWHDWLTALAAFFESPWIPLLICLIVAMRFFVRPHAHKNGKFPLFTAMAACLCFLIFSFSLVFLHALSDVPILSAPKLVASFGFYAAITFSVLLFHALSRLAFPEQLPRLARSLLALATLSVLTWLVLNTANFRQTFTNAANGSMCILASEMARRDLWFALLREQNAIQPDPTGLLGEILFPDTRSRKARPDLSQAIVEKLNQAVFPVYMQEPLAPDCESWPNLWGAWMYGQGCVRAIAPADTLALANARSGQLLVIPEVFRNTGLSAAWRVDAQGGEGPTFALSWLVIEHNQKLPASLNVFRMNPVSAGRLLPMDLQEKWQANLYKKTDFLLDWKAHLSGAILNFTTSASENERGLVAVPLGQMREFSTTFPPVIFISFDGSEFYAIQSASTSQKQETSQNDLF